MAVFLNRNGMNKHIADMLSSSTSAVTIISPYLDLSEDIKKRIRKADDDGTSITIIYRNEDLTEENKFFIYSLKNVQIWICGNLHAKCYYNERYMVLGSMNLYEYSQLNNWEMGVLIDKAEDEVLFTAVEEEVQKNLEAPDSKFQPTIEEFNKKSGLTWNDYERHINKNREEVTTIQQKVDAKNYLQNIDKYIDILNSSSRCVIDDYLPNKAFIHATTEYKQNAIEIELYLRTPKAQEFHDQLITYQAKAASLMQDFSSFYINCLDKGRPVKMAIVHWGDPQWVMAPLFPQVVRKTVELLESFREKNG